MKTDLYQTVTDRILAALETGTAPWVKPWSSIGGDAQPRNAVSGRAYSGVNVLLLWITASACGYEESRWLTFNQAKQAGGSVRKGEKGTQVIFFKRLPIKDKTTGEEKTIPLLKAYTVFNLSQCDGLDHLRTPAPVVNEHQRDEIADAFLKSTGADIRHGEGQAYYTRKHDYVMLPDLCRFNTADDYYSTAFHELGHWTGHSDRLDRDMGKRFGDHAYAAEELVAELTSAFLCAEFSMDMLTQSAAYLGHWVAMLKADNKAIVRAAADATKAADHLRGLALAEDDDMQAAA